MRVSSGSLGSMNKLLLPTLLFAFALPACKSDDASKKAAPAEPSAKPTDLAEPTEPAAASYSPEAATAALAEMAKCDSQYSCEVLETLVGFGDKVSADLSKVALDSSKKKEQREVALAGLAKIKDPAHAMALFEAAKVEEDFILRGQIFDAAGASADETTINAMLDHYVSDDSKPHRTDMRSSLRKYDNTKLFAWAVDKYPADEKLQVRYADLISDAKDGGDAAKVVALIGKTTNLMAQHRLAKTAVELDDMTQLDLLIKGLSHDNVYDRSDAANFLAQVHKKIPAERHAEIVEAVTAAKANDQGGLTSRGYDTLLKKLGK